jgi:hypothetical protein
LIAGSLVVVRRSLPSQTDRLGECILEPRHERTTVIRKHVHVAVAIDGKQVDLLHVIRKFALRRVSESSALLDSGIPAPRTSAMGVMVMVRGRAKNALAVRRTPS